MYKKQILQPKVELILLSAADCARICGISRKTWFQLFASSRTPACVLVGASPRWPLNTLEMWIELGCPDRKTFEAMQKQNSKTSDSECNNDR